MDFDGVIADTIKVTYNMLNEEGIDIKDNSKVSEFYRKLDWKQLLESTNEINKAFDEIDLLQDSGIYNIYILTTVNSLDEMKSKINYVRDRNKNIGVICVPKGIDKCCVVDANNAILVDDYKGNLRVWEKNGGIGICFTKEQECEFITIDSLIKLIDGNILNKIINKSLKLTI